MVGLLTMDPLLDQITGRVVVSIFSGALWLMLSLVLLRIFNTRNPTIKYIFLTVPLVKGLTAIVRETPVVDEFRGAFLINMQFPDLGGLLPKFPDLKIAEYHPTSTLASAPGLILVGSAIVFLAWRVAGLVRFQKILSSAPEIARAEYQELYRIVDALVNKTGIAYPKIIAVRSREAPFTVGVRQPVIAVSPRVIKNLSKGELEAVLAHEIAHIRRRDYLYHWLVVLMRDLLFFSPITHWVYQRLSYEKERACDDFGSSMSQPMLLAKSLIRLAELRQEEPTLGSAKRFAPQSLLGVSESFFARRVKELINPKPYITPSPVGRSVVGLLVLVMLYVEFHMVIMIDSRPLVLS